MKSEEVADFPYEIYYFSRNLEHVLHDISEDLDDDAKEDLAYPKEKAQIRITVDSRHFQYDSYQTPHLTTGEFYNVTGKNLRPAQLKIYSE